jgi:outer membrane protein W
MLEAPSEGSPGCRLTSSRGVNTGDAETATHMLCSEIVQAGAPAASRYRVAFGSLGSLIIVSVDREGEAPGSVADSRTMTLHGIEEIRIAAPRLAQSLVNGTPLASTQTVDNVVTDEGRVPVTKPGKMQVGLGLAGAFTPYDGMGLAPAFVGDLHYGMSQIEISGSLRFSSPGSWSADGASDRSSPTGGIVSLSIGGRYFTSDKEVSPYFGGGVAYSYFRLALPNGFDGSGSGLGVYLDAGVEILRTHKSRLAIGVRFDLPFFAVNDTNGTPRASLPTGAPVPGNVYFAPISVEARLTF